ncbi:MAG: riboflavin biosynthesis protein RibD, partial [Bacteroidetes bacterium]
FNSIKSEQKHNLNYIKIDFNDDVLNSVLSKLYELEIQSLVIEGGEKLLTSFINANLWDEARIFVGNKYFKEGVKAPHFPFKPIEGIQLGDTLLYYYKNS